MKVEKTPIFIEALLANGWVGGLEERSRGAGAMKMPAGSEPGGLLDGGNGSSGVLFGNVLIGVIRHHHRGDDTDDRADRDVDRDGVARSVGGEQCRRDQRRRPTGGDRCELVADRTAAVAQSWREAFGDQGGL